MELRHLTDAALCARLQALVSQERSGVADIIEHLAEADRREIALDAGYASLFEYCVKTLRYSESQAFLRIRAARAAADYPRILPDLRSGKLTLDSVMRLSPHLNGGNSDRLLDRASGATKKEILALVASLGSAGPAPERDVIRRLPPKRPEPGIPASPASVPGARAPQLESAGGAAESPPAAALPPAEPPAALPPAPPPAASPPAAASPPMPALRAAASPPGPAPRAASSGAEAPEVIPPPERVRLGFTADDRLVVKIERLRSLRRHKFPKGRLEDILEEAIDALLAKLEPGRPVEHRGPHRTPGPGSRWIPNAVKREVWKRDAGRCAYLAPDGRRCESREFLEYDHILPWALGGRSDRTDNVRLLCRPHNQRLGRRRFGPRR